MTVEGYQLVYCCLCSHSVCALIYPNGKTRRSCRFQPPNATTLIAVLFTSVLRNTQPTDGNIQRGVALLTSRHPKVKVISSASSDAGAEGNSNTPICHLRDSTNRHLREQLDHSYLADAIARMTPRRSQLWLRCFSQDVSFSVMVFFVPGKYSRLKAT